MKDVLSEQIKYVTEINPGDYSTYNEFVAAKIEGLPEVIFMIIPSLPNESQSFHILQLRWLEQYFISKDFQQGKYNIN